MSDPVPMQLPRDLESDQPRPGPARPGHADSRLAGSKRAWIESVLADHERQLVLYAFRFLRDEDRARDVVQDAFLKLWQVERREVEDHLAAWLYTVCRNRALDIRRKERRMTLLGETPVTATPAPTTEPAGTGLVAFVDALPERQREAVQLRFQGGLSYKEIAEVMGTTVNNVGVTLHAAIKTIRAHMAEPAPAGGSGS